MRLVVANVLAIGLLVAGEPAADAAILTSSAREATVQIFAIPSNPSHSETLTHGLDAHQQKVIDANEPGVYLGSASYNAKTNFGPSNPGIGGAFDRFDFDFTSYATGAALQQFRSTESKATVNSVITFTLAEPTEYTLDLSWARGTSITGNMVPNNGLRVMLNISGGGSLLFQNLAGDNGQQQFTGLLNAGTYSLRIEVTAQTIFNSPNGTGSGNVTTSIAGSFVIPEPASAALLAAGVVGLALRRRG